MNEKMIASLEARQYDPSLFVNRQRELQMVAERVNLAQAGSLAEAILDFWGIRGSGKSWLLRHIHHLYAYRVGPAAFGKPTVSLYFAFDETSGDVLISKLVDSLTEQLEQQIGASLTADVRTLLATAMATGTLKPIVQVLKQLLETLVLVLVLDNTETTRTRDWKQIEEALIEPLITTNRVLCVVAGRQHITTWHRFETRRRVRHAQDTLLDAFTKDVARLQLERGGYRVPLRMEEFYTYTAGSPLLLDKFAQQMESWRTTEHVSGAALLDAHKPELLHVLQAWEGQMLGKATEWLPVLNVLSPLRFYRSEALRFMLQDVEPESHSDIYYLDILRQLDRNTDVIWWDRERKAYVTSPIVRRMMNRRQCLDQKQRPRYMAQHEKALLMYGQWLEQYPETSEDYICEVWFHLASIYLANQDEGKLEQSLEQSLVLIDALQIDHLNALSRQLSDDQELIELLPPEQYIRLRRAVSAKLDRA